jgi:integrase
MVPEVVEELAKHLASRGGGPNDHVWPSPHGGVLPMGRFRQRFWAPALRTAGIEGLLVPHELRHTAYTLWRAANVHVEHVARWVGHSDPGQLLKVYSDLGEMEGVDTGCSTRSALWRPDR